MSTTYTVHVTRKDLRGPAFDAFDCPLARAISRATSNQACVGVERAHLERPFVEFDMPPKAVSRFRWFSWFPRWMRWIVFPPFSFELTIP
jgi:hypothetical protein